MTEPKIAVELKKPDSSGDIVFGQSNTSLYLNYASDSSVIPSSLDQIIKNNILIWGVAAES